MRKIATTEPLLIDRLVAPDGHAAGVVLTLIMPDAHSSEASVAIGAARDLIAQFREKFPKIEIRLSGSTGMSNGLAC